MIAIDIRTAYLLVGLMFIVMPTIAWAVLNWPRAGPVALWCGGGMLMGFGAVFIGLRDTAPVWISFTLSNLMLFIGMLMRIQALKIDRGRFWHAGMIVLASLVFVCAYEYVRQVLGDSLLRLQFILVISVALFLQLSIEAWQLGRQQASRSARWIAYVSLFAALAMTLRFGELTLGLAAADAMGATPATALTTVAGMLSAVISHVGYVGIVLERLQRQKQETAKEYQAVINTALDGFWTIDNAGRITDVNSAFCSMVGFERKELLGKSLADLDVPLEPPGDGGRGHPLLAARVGLFEARQRRKDGRLVDVEVSVNALDIGDGRLVGFTRDITARKQLEQKLHQLNQQLEGKVAERTRSLVKINAELQTITYTLAHDLRQPARHVAGFAKLLSESFGEGLPEKGKRWLALMTISAERQAALVEAMLNYMKLGFRDLLREPIDMGVLAEELRKAACDEDERAAKAAWQVGELPAVDGDRALIRVILSNLMANAVKYSARAEAPRIDIGATQEEGRPCAYFVRDNGVGFDPARTGQLFGLFQRFHDPVEYPGSGIGLAIVKRLVEKHGGRTWAESAPGAGATFYFTLQAEDRRNERRAA